MGLTAVLILFPLFISGTMASIDRDVAILPMWPRAEDNPFRGMGDLSMTAHYRDSAALYDSIIHLANPSDWLVINDEDSTDSLAKKLGVTQMELEFRFGMRDSETKMRSLVDMPFGKYWRNVKKLGNGTYPTIQRARDYSDDLDGKYSHMTFWRIRPAVSPYKLNNGDPTPTTIGKADATIRKANKVAREAAIMAGLKKTRAAKEAAQKTAEAASLAASPPPPSPMGTRGNPSTPLSSNSSRSRSPTRDFEAVAGGGESSVAKRLRSGANVMTAVQFITTFVSSFYESAKPYFTTSGAAFVAFFKEGWSSIRGQNRNAIRLETGAATSDGDQRTQYHDELARVKENELRAYRAQLQRDQHAREQQSWNLADGNTGVAAYTTESGFLGLPSSFYRFQRAIEYAPVLTNDLLTDIPTSVRANAKRIDNFLSTAATAGYIDKNSWPMACTPEDTFPNEMAYTYKEQGVGGDDCVITTFSELTAYRSILMSTYETKTVDKLDRRLATQAHFDKRNGGLVVIDSLVRKLVASTLQSIRQKLR